MKRIVVLGSTGSIGKQTLDVVKKNPNELKIVGLSAGSNASLLFEQASEYGVDKVALATFNGCNVPENLDLAIGKAAVADLARLGEADIVVNALQGAIGLEASLAALRAGKTLALANKESIVVGGDLIMPLASLPGNLMPIDSEHGAILQCLVGEEKKSIEKIWLTASGGPFRSYTLEELKDVSLKQALDHPTWKMGSQISINSATLMNKGLEVIEAHHLFSCDFERISVVVHPQSVIHSMIEFSDASVKAHLGTTDMRIPIQYALSYPERWPAPVKPLDFTELGQIDFEPVNTDVFRLFSLALTAGREGGTYPCVMNAANEVAVDAFLNHGCSFLDITYCVEAVMDGHVPQAVESLEQLSELDSQARISAKTWLKVHN